MLELILGGIILYFVVKKVKEWGEDMAYMNTIEEPYKKEKSLEDAIRETTATGFYNGPN